MERREPTRIDITCSASHIGRSLGLDLLAQTNKKVVHLSYSRVVGANSGSLYVYLSILSYGVFGLFRVLQSYFCYILEEAKILLIIA